MSDRNWYLLAYAGSCAHSITDKYTSRQARAHSDTLLQKWWGYGHAHLITFQDQNLQSLLYRSAPCASFSLVLPRVYACRYFEIQLGTRASLIVIQTPTACAMEETELSRECDKTSVAKHQGPMHAHGAPSNAMKSCKSNPVN